MRKVKILIADDDVDYVEVLQSSLEHEGYQTLSAYEGVRTIELANKEKPDLILLDLKMPAGRGETVLKTLHRQNETRKIPVIVITGLPEGEIQDEIFSLGAKDFIKKPYDNKVLMNKIKMVLEAGS